MKITDIKTHVINPIEPLIWVLVEVETDEGTSGLGECTEYIGNAHLVRGLQAIRPYVIGSDARAWHPRPFGRVWERNR